MAWNNLIQQLQKSIINPVVKLAWELGSPPPGDALLLDLGYGM